MSKFLSMLPITPRTLTPKYVSQWRDEIVVFDENLSGVDYIEVGYPYSYKNLQINPSGDGSTTNMTLIDGNPMFTIDDQYMERI